MCRPLLTVLNSNINIWIMENGENNISIMLSYLTQLSAKFEMIADEIDNKYLRNALCAIAAEANQYAMELNYQLRSAAIIPSLPCIYELLDGEWEKKTNSNKEEGKELLSIFETCELFITQLYTELLAGNLTEALKNIITYQFFGIKSAFMRIRFLNSSRFDALLMIKPV